MPAALFPYQKNFFIIERKQCEGSNRYEHSWTIKKYWFSLSLFTYLVFGLYILTAAYTFIQGHGATGQSSYFFYLHFVLPSVYFLLTLCSAFYLVRFKEISSCRCLYYFCWLSVLPISALRVLQWRFVQLSSLQYSDDAMYQHFSSFLAELLWSDCSEMAVYIQSFVYVQLSNHHLFSKLHDNILAKIWGTGRLDDVIALLDWGSYNFPDFALRLCPVKKCRSGFWSLAALYRFYHMYFICPARADYREALCSTRNCSHLFFTSAFQLYFYTAHRAFVWPAVSSVASALLWKHLYCFCIGVLWRASCLFIWCLNHSPVLLLFSAAVICIYILLVIKEKLDFRQRKLLPMTDSGTGQHLYEVLKNGLCPQWRGISAHYRWGDQAETGFPRSHSADSPHDQITLRPFVVTKRGGCYELLLHRYTTKQLLLVIGAEKESIQLRNEEMIWLELMAMYSDAFFSSLKRMEELMEEASREIGDIPWVNRLVWQFVEQEKAVLAQELHDTVLQEQLYLARELDMPAALIDATKVSHIREQLLDISYELRNIVKCLIHRCSTLLDYNPL